MVAEEVNEKELRKELIEIYEGFLKNPEDKIIEKKAIDYDKIK